MTKTWLAPSLTGALVTLLLTSACAWVGRDPRAVDRDLDLQVERVLSPVQETQVDEREESALRPEPAAPEPPQDPEGPADPDVPEVTSASSPGPEQIYDLARSLETAYRTNRQMLSEREAVYLAALALIGARHTFAPRVSALMSYMIADSDLGPEAQDGSASATLTKILDTGGDLNLTGGTDWRDVDGDGTFSSSARLQLSQPLLRGAGYEVSHEPLVQAERNLIYALRDFELFREDFSIDVASRYYGLVGRLEAIDNRRRSYEGNAHARRKAEALFAVERGNELDVLRARRTELNAKDDLLTAIEDYELALDRFKVFLGLDFSVPIVIEETSPPFQEVNWDVESAVACALENRLDYLNRQEQLVDSERDVRIARDGLRSELDLNASYARSGPGESDFLDQDLDDEAWNVGITWSPAIDRVFEKNAYRSSQIQYQRDMRSFEEFEDNLVIEIYSSFRELKRRTQSLAIQEELIVDETKNLRIAEIRFERGELSNRNVVDAQESMLDAENSKVSEQINYEIARLQLLRDLGILFIDDHGMWREP